VAQAQAQVQVEEEEDDPEQVDEQVELHDEVMEQVGDAEVVLHDEG